MKVKEVYKDIDLDYISEKAEESEYHATADKFLNDVWDRDAETLTPKQSNWLDKIEAECAENQ